MILPKKALVVGLDKYENELGGLEFCTKDAAQMKECLTIPEFGFEVEYLTDEFTKVSRSKLSKALRDLFSQDASFYLFYYSGHGHKGTFETVFVTSDLEELDEGVPMGYLNTLIAQVKNPNAPILLIIDCCYSGSISLDKISISQQSITDSFNPNKIDRVIIASCLEDETSKENYKLAGSPFSYYLFEALAGEVINKNGEITVDGIFNYISEKLSVSKQTPLRSGQSRKIVLASGFEKADDSNEINEDELKQYEKVCIFHKERLRAVVEAKRSNDPVEWNLNGYRSAQATISDAVEWFNKHAPIKSLSQLPIFQSTLNDLKFCLSEMVFVQPGIHTSKGQIVAVNDDDIDENFQNSIELSDGSVGLGGFGKVWKVVDSQQKSFAYKICHSENLRTPEMIKWFRRGYNTMKRLNHPNIVKVYEGDFTEAPVGFYMEYIDGVDWSRYSPHKYLDLNEQLEQLISLTKTIQYAHKEHITHRDIKPKNILFIFKNTGRESLLTDFDLAWHTMDSIISDNKQVKSLLSTLSYASPEFRRNPESEQARQHLTDIYSFGQLMYFVFTGTDPSLSSEDNKNLLEQKLGEWPVVEAADIFQGLYDKCTKIAPGNRIQSMEEIEVKLTEIARLITRGNAELTPKLFLDQLMFSQLGMNRQSSINTDALEASYLAANNKIQFVIELKNTSSRKKLDTASSTDIQISVNAQDEVVLEGSHNFVDSKNILREKFTKLCQHEKLVLGKVINSPAFSTDVTAQDILLDDESIKRISEILRKISEFFVTRH